MLQIHVDHIAAAERVLAALEDSSADLFRVARHVSAIPELGRRMTDQASDRARRPVRLVEDAIVMLGAQILESATRTLIEEWLHALEQPGLARVVTPLGCATPSPELRRTFRPLARGA